MIVMDYKGSQFVLTENGSDYRILGLDSAAEDIWFPDNYMGKRILPWVSLNHCSNETISNYHSFWNVKRLHIPDWVSSLNAENFLFPKLEEIDIHPSQAHSEMSSLGPLLMRGKELMRVFSVGYMDTFTFPKAIQSVGDSAFAYTTITDINFEHPYIQFSANAFGGSRINQLINNGEKQFITFGNLLYRCVYVDSKKLRIPDHIRSFEKNAFKDTYFKHPDGSKDWSNPDYVEEIESPVPIHANRSFKSVKKYYVHSFAKQDIENLRGLFPNMNFFTIRNGAIEAYSSDYETHHGVLFTKAMDALVICPLNTTEYTVPEGVLRIEPWAFRKNEYIIRVHLPKSLIFIGDRAFCDTPIESIQIPENVEIIENFAFNRTKIKEIYLPKSVKSIGNGALNGISRIQCFEGTARGLFNALHSNYSDENVGYSVDIEITRMNGDILKLFIPSGLKNTGCDLLEAAWDNPPFDIHAYHQCYAHCEKPIDRYRFAHRIYQLFGPESACAEYFRRIVSKYAQILIAENAQEDLIEVLKFGIIKPSALRKLLESVHDKDMPTVSAYILQALSECEEKRKTLRL